MFISKSEYIFTCFFHCCNKHVIKDNLWFRFFSNFQMLFCLPPFHLDPVPTPPICFTKVLNSTTVQVLWELPAKPGKVEGFKLTFRRIPLTDYHEPIKLPFHASAHTISNLGKTLWQYVFILFVCVCLRIGSCANAYVAAKTVFLRSNSQI